jgi:hypothetical protein
MITIAKLTNRDGSSGLVYDESMSLFLRKGTNDDEVYAIFTEKTIREAPQLLKKTEHYFNIAMATLLQRPIPIVMMSCYQTTHFFNEYTTADLDVREEVSRQSFRLKQHQIFIVKTPFTEFFDVFDFVKSSKIMLMTNN